VGRPKAARADRPGPAHGRPADVLVVRAGGPPARGRAGGVEIALEDAAAGGLLLRRKRAVGRVLAGLGEALGRAAASGRPARLTVVVEPRRAEPRVAVEDLPTREVGAAVGGDELDAALAEARACGARRAAEVLAGPGMLGADAFAALIGATRETVRQKRRRREVLGLEGARRGVRYPDWQVTDDGGLLPALPRLFGLLGDSPWAVHRFLLQRHPELDGARALDALRAGRAGEVLDAAENAGRAFA
jgi:hypothetical protein